MPLLIESGLEFTLPAQIRYERHDAVNRIWPGVDFLIDDPADWIWLEVKNWEPSTLQPSRRGGQRRAFLCKLRSDRFFTETLRAKFLGTTSYLAHRNELPIRPILYIMLLESPRFDSALMLHANQRMRSQIPPAYAGQPWRQSISVAVLNVQEWNRRFPSYPARHA